jgi:hypothetical protein
MALIGILSGAIIVLISGIAAWAPVPGYHWKPTAGHPPSPLCNMRTIVAAQIVYHDNMGQFAPDFKALVEANPPYLTGDWDIVNDGYYYYLSGHGQKFMVRASPEDPEGKGLHYFADQTGVVFCEHDAPANAKSPSLGG